MYDNAPASLYVRAIHEHAVSKFADHPECLVFCVTFVIGNLCGCGNREVDSETIQGEKKPPDSVSEMYSGLT